MNKSFEKFRVAGIALGLVLCSGIIACVVAELIVRYTMVSRTERQMGASQVSLRQKNFFAEMVIWASTKYKGPKSGYPTYVLPHPFLGYVHEPLPENGINKEGFRSDHEFPIKKHPRDFYILLTGGSVAHLLGLYSLNKVARFEAILNERYKNPKGGVFRVINGAIGGWVMPQQLMTIALYGDQIDGIISLDGYNEAQAIEFQEFGLGSSFTFTTATVNLVAPEMNRAIVRLHSLREASLKVPIVKESFLLMKTYDFLITLAERERSDLRNRLHNLYYPLRQADVAVQKGRDFERYSNYLRNIHALAKAQKVFYSHFIQPVRFFGKELTAEEAAFADFVEPDSYKKMHDRLLHLRQEGVAIHSLLDLLQNVKETVYADRIHFKFGATGHSLGNELLAERIAATIAKDWGFKTTANVRKNELESQRALSSAPSSPLRNQSTVN